jgi:hypothetical protein
VIGAALWSIFWATAVYLLISAVDLLLSRLGGLGRGDIIRIRQGFEQVRSDLRRPAQHGPAGR